MSRAYSRGRVLGDKTAEDAISNIEEEQWKHRFLFWLGRLAVRAPTQARIVREVDINDLSQAEVCEMLGLSSSNASIQYRKGRYWIDDHMGYGTSRRGKYS